MKYKTIRYQRHNKNNMFRFTSGSLHPRVKYIYFKHKTNIGVNYYFGSVTKDYKPPTHLLHVATL